VTGEERKQGPRGKEERKKQRRDKIKQKRSKEWANKRKKVREGRKGKKQRSKILYVIADMRYKAVIGSSIP